METSNSNNNLPSQIIVNNCEITDKQKIFNEFNEFFSMIGEILAENFDSNDSGFALFLRNKVKQGLYGQGKSGENISFSRWSGKVRENQGKSGNSTKKSGKTWKKSGKFFWKVLISYESRSIVYFSCCMSNKLDFILFSLFRYFLILKVAWNV